MSISRQLRTLTTLLSIFLILGLIGCKSTPEPEPEKGPVVVEDTTKPTPEPEPEPEPKEQVVVPLSQDEINAARDAVQRANHIGANQYYPTEYRALISRLNDGISLGESDPEAARAVLKSVITDANKLYDKTLNGRKDEYIGRYYKSDEALQAIEAEKFAPAEYEATQLMAAETLESWESGDLAGAQAKADETLTAQARLYHNLNENIRYVGILKRDTENYLGDAEDNEAFIYSPDELEAANEYYFDGVSAYRNYKLEDSAGILTEAKKAAVLAARTSAVRKRQAETDSLMSETQRRIESASGLRTMSAEGEVVEARPWDGNEYLSTNPLVDHAADVGPVEIDDPVLRNLDEPVNNEGDGIPEDIPIENTGTQVNADEQDTDYLVFAQALWEKGVTARNAGQFDLAQDYFRQAQAYVDVYESNAVSSTYTVVWRETATDCLWRIAEMDDIFSNAYLWPKIWRANRRLIQNPDLIYPGQILVIPPK